MPTYQEMVKMYGSTEAWQKNPSKQWIQKLILLKKPLIILEESFNPEFVVNSLKQYDKNNYLIFCIHADQKIREDRLVIMLNQQELVTQDMENFSQFLKNKTAEMGGIIIENNSQNTREIAEKTVLMINKDI